MVVIERVGCISVHLQRGQWAGASSDVEDGFRDAWLRGPRTPEAVAGELLDFRASAS